MSGSYGARGEGTARRAEANGGNARARAEERSGRIDREDKDVTESLMEDTMAAGDRFGLTVCGEAFEELMEAKGVGGTQGLARLFAKADYDMDEGEIRAQLTGEEEVDPTFPGAFAILLRLDRSEEETLARNVIHGQMVCRVAR